MWRSVLNKLLFPLAFAEGEGGGEGGEGAGSDVQQQLTDANVKLATAATDKKSLEDAKVDLERKLDDADRELLSEDYLTYKEGKGKSKDKGNGGDGGEGAADANFDINNASPAELAAYIKKGSKGDLDAVVKELSGRLEKSDERVGLALAQVDISLTAIRHPDNAEKLGFNENFDAIKVIAKANPEWGAEKCYQQFKLEKTGADKATEEAARKKAEDDLKSSSEKGEGVPGSTTQGKELTKEEAADVAYRKAFGNKE